MHQILPIFPKSINNFYEPFVGGGTVFLNVQSKKYFLSDLQEHLIAIHKYLLESSKQPYKFFADIEGIINTYRLSYSYKRDMIPIELKEKYKKTYYAKFNKENYEELRLSLNQEDTLEPIKLYILLIYGFNRMLRFNSKGKFNLPVGNVDFNTNVFTALNNYFNFVKDKHIIFSKSHFTDIFNDYKPNTKDFFYIDPPYLIGSAEYNKMWNEESETMLLENLDKLNNNNVKFALSNVLSYNGHKNHLLANWMKDYKVYRITSNYINYHNNGKKDIKEVLITNY